MLARAFSLLVTLVAIGCADVLGIEQASLDPNLGTTSLNESADAGGEASAEPQTLCELYCETVLHACDNDEDGSFAVYDSRFTCAAQCELMNAGADGDESGNSVACRLFHARIAEMSPGERLTECPAAGPGGDGVCGSNCEGYCTLMLATCSGTFESQGACLAACATVPDLGGYDIGQTAGDSLQCRLYHVGAALASQHHCAHAAGAYPCSPPETTTDAAG
jgi:hypothetical protein